MFCALVSVSKIKIYQAGSIVSIIQEQLLFYFTYISSALVGSAFGAFWEEPEGGFIKFMVKRASKQDQTLHMEGKLHVILYFREECVLL